MGINKKSIIAVARIKLPLVVEALTKANLEAQSQNPSLDRLKELLDVDDIDGYYDVTDLLRSYLLLEDKLQNKDPS